MTAAKRDFDWLESIYRNGGSTRGSSRILFLNAQRLLKKSNLARNLSRARDLGKVRKLLYELGPDHAGFEHALTVFKEQSAYYDVIVDDVIIVGAFELYAKAMLLKKQRLPHVITKPGPLARGQKNRPIHFRTYRSELKKGDVSLSTKTLAASTLIGPGYRSALDLPASVFPELRKIIERRNRIHFHGAMGWTIESSMIDAVQSLSDAIDRWVK